MRFGKLTMFLLLHALAALVLLFYFGLWMIDGRTKATIVRPFYANTITATYTVQNQSYTASYSRYDIPYSARSVDIRYLLFRPASSRINSFMGLAAEPFGWWLVFLLASAMLLLMPNTVFSRGTVFQIHKKFPWISMDEYFPEEAGWWNYQRTKQKAKKEKSQKLLDKK